MITSGHVIGEGSFGCNGRRTDDVLEKFQTGNFDKKVIQTRQNFQSSFMGENNAVVRLYTFDFENNLIKARTYCVNRDIWITDPDNCFDCNYDFKMELNK